MKDYGDAYYRPGIDRPDLVVPMSKRTEWDYGHFFLFWTGPYRLLISASEIMNSPLNDILARRSPVPRRPFTDCSRTDKLIIHLKGQVGIKNMARLTTVVGELKYRKTST